ncbi:MAG TPA: sigma 54-interacting transcriptional regulator [Myxococcales bacterium]|nr:sigma 54-interacting transcriptional regulator [Myxococcales bacterium]
MRPDPDRTDLRTDVTHLPLVSSRAAPVLEWSDAKGAHRHVVAGRTLAGSSEQSQLRIFDKQVSRTHAELEPRDDGLWVRDLGSLNGTFVERVRVERARVPEGGAVRLGAVSLALRQTETKTVELWPADRLGDLIGRSAPMRELFMRLVGFASSPAPVLVTGETGTGKELVARALHEHSPRRGGPFAVVDCGSLPETLLQAELFGHARGAFTGAHEAREGAAAAAAGGTLFLDEVGELPLEMQPKLLRLIEAGTVRRLGDSQYRTVDVRVVAATHRDLGAMVAQGTFREDLFYRLAVLPLEVPPLRARPEDLEPLLASFLNGKAIDATTLAALEAHRWPGNVRELRTLAQRAELMGWRQALEMLRSGRSGEAGLPQVSLATSFKQERERWLDHLEREYIAGLMRKHDRNVTRVAEAAGLDRSYVHRLLKKHGI